ncbi:MAG: hypothetical protein ACON46_07375 [Coraliomargaritaceae bacterium]
MRAFIWIGLISCTLAMGLQAHSQSTSTLCDRLSRLGNIYDHPEGSLIQRFDLYLAYMHQFGVVRGEDRFGSEVEHSAEEVRRFWFGGQGEFLDVFRFKAVSQVSNDRHNFPGGKREFGHETFRSAYISLRADTVLDLSAFDSLSLGYGRRSGRMADEWQRSATHINTLERSAFSNRLWLADKERGNPLAVWTKARMGRSTVDLALFSGSYSDWIGGWNDSRTYYASFERDFSESTGWETTDLWLSAYYQDGEMGQDRLARGNETGFAWVARLADGPWAFHATLGFGDNGSQKNPDQEGGFWGAVLMPMYWLVEDQQKLVFRYQYQSADEAEGIRLNNRYARMAAADDESLDLNSRRGDTHHNFYLGYNYYFCGEQLKLVSGIQWDELRSDGDVFYRGWTLGTSLRFLL